MRSPRRALAAALALTWAIGCGGAGPLPATGELRTEPFPSTVVGDEYLLRIRLPPGYDPDAAPGYPLILQLDPTYAGLEEYAITVGLVSDHAGRGEWPEAIVVGVDYPDDPSLRERDYLPASPPDPDFAGAGADRFYRMLADELLPALEAEYAIDPGRRFLLGHSNGGVFVWYAAFRHDPGVGPPLFAGAVAADNGYDEVLFTLERWHAERADDLPMAIFTTRAVYNGAIQEVVFEAMQERLRGRDFPGLRLASEVLETDHGGAIVPSYERGLDRLLGGDP
ncbi:MAG: alpha/beta hydrolase-fold protein [Nannocystaceae bacterium]